MHHNFYDYQPMRGAIPTRIAGVLVSIEQGRTTAYALDSLQERGTLFVGAGEQVYEGQIAGEHCRDNDLPVNVCREKKLTNMRASGAEKSIILNTPGSPKGAAECLNAVIDVIPHALDLLNEQPTRHP